MWNTLKTFFARVKVYSFWIVTCAFSIGLTVVSFIISSKNKKIRELQSQVALQTARLELEQVLLKHQATLDEVRRLREADCQVHDELKQIEDQLAKRLSPDMTAEQIAAKFREVGIDWKE